MSISPLNPLHKAKQGSDGKVFPLVSVFFLFWRAGSNQTYKTNKIDAYMLRILICIHLTPLSTQGTPEVRQKGFPAQTGEECESGLWGDVCIHCNLPRSLMAPPPPIHRQNKILIFQSESSGFVWGDINKKRQNLLLRLTY